MSFATAPLGLPFVTFAASARRRGHAVRAAALLGLVFFTGAAGSADATTLDIQGHRGGRGLMPENSLSAFEKALALRVPTLELDLQVTKDWVLVVHHDPHLDSKGCVHDDGGAVPRTLVEQLNYHDLAGIDCGRRTNPHFPERQAVAQTRIPHIEQVLALARDAGYPVRLSIELKWQKRKDGMSVEEYAERLVTLVKQYGLEGRTTVQSFHASALKALLRLEPSIARAILVREPGDYDRLIEQSAATILSPRYDGLQREDVERFRQRKILVIPWTVNESVDMCRMIAWGVDGLITDYPDRALRLVSERACRRAR